METIRFSDGALKVRTGRFIVYDYDWLLEHLDSETAILQGAKRIKNAPAINKYRRNKNDLQGNHEGLT